MSRTQVSDITMPKRNKISMKPRGHHLKGEVVISRCFSVIEQIDVGSRTDTNSEYSRGPSNNSEWWIVEDDWIFWKDLFWYNAEQWIPENKQMIPNDWFRLTYKVVVQSKYHDSVSKLQWSVISVTPPPFSVLLLLRRVNLIFRGWTILALADSFDSFFSLMHQ